MATYAKLDDGLGFVRMLLVASSLSPVFLLWAIRGVAVIPELYWISGCIALFVLCNGTVYFYIERAKKTNNIKSVTVQKAEDHREFLLVYLFAMLIPLYDASVSSWRDLIAWIVVFVFICFIFWYSRLHYMNIFFALFGYRIYTCDVQSGTYADGTSSKRIYVIITRQQSLAGGALITGYRMGADVLLETNR